MHVYAALKAAAPWNIFTVFELGGRAQEER